MDADQLALQGIDLGEGIMLAIVTLKKTSHVAGVAGRSCGMDAQKQRVPVAIQTNVNNMLYIPGGAALMPQFLPAARPKMGFGSGDCFLDGLCVHIGQH